MKTEILKDDLIRLYVEKNKTDKEIAEIYSTNIFRIWKLRKEYGIEGINARHRKFFENPQVSITPRQMSIINGSLLGDSCLKNNSTQTAYLSIAHTIKQKEYVDWIYNELKSICPTLPKKYTSKDNKYITYYFASESRRDLKEIRDKIYIPHKTVSKWWINQIDDMGLAVWYMDDGSLQYINKTKSVFSFATNSFSQEENYILAGMLKDKFSLNIEVRPFNKKSGIQYNLFISDDSFEDFQKIVSPYVIESMKYKLPCDLSNVHLQKNLKCNVNKEILEKLYYENSLTQDQMASILGVHKSTVRKYMHIFSIKPRDNQEAQLNGKNNKSKRQGNGRFMAMVLEGDGEKRAFELFREFRKNSFPYLAIKDENHYIGTIDRLNNANGTIVDNTFRYSRSAIEICSSLCPQIFSMSANNSLSPLEIFKDDNMLMDCIRRTIKFAKKDTIASVRQGLKTYRNNRCVTIFPPEWGKVIIQDLFKNSENNLSLLDFSCGFGGRLIGAYASDRVKYYLGIDPLSENIESHKKIYSLIQQHAVLKNKKFDADFICGSVEEVIEGVSDKFNIVFTSPPYFNKEIYASSKGQCYNLYPKYEDWRDLWLEKILTQSYGLLTNHGAMIIFMGNCGKIDIKKDCMDIMTRISGSVPLIYKFLLPSIEYNRNKNIKKFEVAFVIRKQ